MAKKKTENIKAAPVLRSQPEQPTPTPEQTGTRTYQIMDPWKDRDKVNLVDVKSVDGEITEVKVNGEPAGGGGGVSSDGLLITKTLNADEIPCLNKTWNEINTAYSAQLPIMFYKVGTYPTLEAFGYVSRCEYISRLNTYYVDVYMGESTVTYLCTNADERPHIDL